MCLAAKAMLCASLQPGMQRLTWSAPSELPPELPSSSKSLQAAALPPYLPMLWLQVLHRLAFAGQALMLQAGLGLLMGQLHLGFPSPLALGSAVWQMQGNAKLDVREAVAQRCITKLYWGLWRQSTIVINMWRSWHAATCPSACSGCLHASLEVLLCLTAASRTGVGTAMSCSLSCATARQAHLCSISSSFVHAGRSMSAFNRHSDPL